MQPKLALLFLVGFLFSCAKVTVIPIGEEKSYPQRTPVNRVQVFVEKPDTTFVEIALVDYEGRHRHSKGDVVNGLKKKAAELGGDAIILGELTKESSGAYVNPYSGWVTTYKRPVARAVVIRFIP